jgi:hypothetical protein
MPELDAVGVGCAVPVCPGVAAVAVSDPGGDLFGPGLFVRDAPIEALRGQDGQLRFGEIEPRAVLGRIMPFEPFDSDEVIPRDDLFLFCTRTRRQHAGVPKLPSVFRR